MSTTGSSPIKKAHAAYASHIRSEVEKIVETKTEIVDVATFWKLLGYSPKDFNRVDRHTKSAGIDTMEQMNENSFTSCLNKLSAHMRTKLRLASQAEIKFRDTSNTPPKDHPTGTNCRPDIIATTQREQIQWTGIEATVEVHSAGKTEAGASHQAASYSVLLLQARPDLLAVQGFCVTKSGIMLNIASSSGVQMTEALAMSVPAHRILLYAFINRLYEPGPGMVDPSIKRRWNDTAAPPHYVFDITLMPADADPVVFSGYRTVYARESLGQRAHVFANEANPTIFKGDPIPVIKDAYCDENTRFTEDEIIKHIHRNGDVPGIVRVAYAEIVCFEGPERKAIVCDGRQKTRLCLKEFGRSIMECRTVKDVLIVMYDQLETTRVVHRNSNVLHRDISAGNIMFRDLPVPPPAAGRVAEKISDAPGDSNNETEVPAAIFCGATYLLGETDDRNFTKNLLIDLERAELLYRKNDELRLPRTGTVRFMSRAIRNGRLLGDAAIIPLFNSPPDISKALLARYRAVLPDRVKRFACKTPRHSPGCIETPSSTVARHALRHDAESVYWVLMWWSVCAAPSGHDATLVPTLIWHALTDNLRDLRPTRLDAHDLDPSYAALHSLLNTLGTFLHFDHHWANEAPYNHSEFLHEAFQRIILNFLVDNANEDFMLLPTTGQSRGHLKASIWAEPTFSRPELLLRTSSAGHSDTSRKRPASSQGELERKAKKATAPVASSSTGMTTRSQQQKRA